MSIPMSKFLWIFQATEQSKFSGIFRRMQFSVGDVVEGKITGITSFGVFVDLGEGKTGMVHISEIARTYVSDIKEHVKEGDVVKAKVMTVSEEGKISLSIKRAMDPPPKQAPRRNNQPPKADASFC